MKKSLIVFLMLVSSVVFAAPVLDSGDYSVSVRDRRGRTHICTLNIQNYTSHLVLNISDCPPPVVDVRLDSFDNGDIFVSEKIYVDTRRGGYKMYEIVPMSTGQFEMISHREYGDGGVGRPRKVIATKK